MPTEPTVEDRLAELEARIATLENQGALNDLARLAYQLGDWLREQAAPKTTLTLGGPDLTLKVSAPVEWQKTT